MGIQSVSDFYAGGTATIHFTAIDANLHSQVSDSQSAEEGGVTVQVAINDASSSVQKITLQSDTGENGAFNYSGTFAVPTDIASNTTYTLTLTAGDADDNGGDTATIDVTGGATPGTNNLPEVPYAAALPIALLGLIPVARRMYARKAASGHKA